MATDSNDKLQKFLSEAINGLTEDRYYGELVLVFRKGICYQIIKKETLTNKDLLTPPGKTEREEEPK